MSCRKEEKQKGFIMQKLSKIQRMVMTGVMTAIIILMSTVPYLGYIPLGFMNATIIHVPVIIGGVILGPKSGAFLGLVFGITSLIKNTLEPNLTSFVFSPFYSIGGMNGNLWSLVICLVPRILIGVVANYVFALIRELLKKRKNSEIPACIGAGIAGSLTNTILVMNLIYLFFGPEYAEAKGTAYQALYGVILGVIFSTGIPEAIVAAVLTVAIVKVLWKALK